MHASLRNLLRGAVLCTCAAAPWLAQAQTDGMPAMKVQDAGRYVCGGVGSDESLAMRAAMKEHPLALLFARASGAYLADVDVMVRDSKGGTALSMRASGPICLVDLPAGRYTVEAASEGVTKSQVVVLEGATKTADFRF
ncbi:carboxypeptidase-like regulatory domain-containing protein [Variovorax saccharolyticus]|uniref:carboxypeptidase-like regulatory domain-containing protein n=1 Tax=Variovorax saccharolyticus TaxID=3053516 RepID=UPI002578429A|nr:MULTISPECIES: carboxypeptidase-like regulatory domain-containing protein [unclassified Variovorax]MDM0017119.1 carboxypeptidase-like regulatory domain-containing protein [Variovorax sp. J22R187]MDM0029347.1 carboxypeptidase-like regulatory domain-containing protein [Variovorax sp. J31P216]